MKGLIFVDAVNREKEVVISMVRRETEKTKKVKKKLKRKEEEDKTRV